MNQTVTVNISGVVFHIEVDSYEALKKYLNKIRSYFKNSEECEEIMVDIEARIAELFSSKISDVNQVILNQDVEEIITIMGKPEQYLDEDELDEEEQPKAQKRTNYANDKKLFRNPDERVLGGVCSGIAAYFGFDRIWARLFFVLATIFWGFGPLLYIILWIVIPVAKTAGDKLQMKGEPINIDNIGKTVQDEASKVNDKLKNIDKGRFGHFIERFFSVLGEILRAIFKVAGNVIGFALIVFGIFLAIGFIAGLSGSDMILAITSDGIFSIESSEFFNLIFVSDDQFQLAIFGIIMLIGIPIITIIYGGVKLLFKVKTHYSIGIVLLIFWITGIAICSLIGIKMGTEVSSDEEIVEEIMLPSNTQNYILFAGTNDIPGKGILDGQFSTISLDEDSIYCNDVYVNVYQSKTDSAYMKVIKEANGESVKAAKIKARGIIYNYKVDSNSVMFNNYLSTAKTNKIRGQEVRIKLYLPIGKSVYFDKTIRKIIYNIPNVTDTYDG
ncbi:MAG: PspC domain-containing protein, partial [Vicingaceae bacterium]|nr:PspC domain-containing protein [Vicingaceae bacterium]